MKSFKPVPIMALLLGLSQSSGNTAAQDLVVVAKIGDSYSYKVTSKIEPVGAVGELNWNSVLRETLVKVDGETLEWESTFVESEADAAGVMSGAEEALNGLVGATMISIQDRRGKVKALRFGDEETPSLGSSNVVLPPSGAKLGASWDANLEVGGRPIPIIYTLDSYEVLEGTKVAKIVGSFPEGSPASTVEPTTYWVERSNGKTMKATSVTVVTAGNFTMRVSYTLVRLKDKEIG